MTNILPKKKWHVRTSENIARVRRDEAQAAEEAKELERRSKLAEQEARTSLLRQRAREKSGLLPVEEEGDTKKAPDDSCSVIGPSGHVNFFQQLEEGEDNVKTNAEHEEEKKKEQEEYEKKVGYLTYLGQDTEELTGEQVWWKRLPKDRLVEKETDQLKTAVRAKQKEFLDPLNDVRKYLKCDGVRLTMKKHEKKLEKVESKAINFEPVTKKKRKRNRSSSRSRSRSRERKKRKKDSRRKDHEVRKSKHKKDKSRKSKKKRRKSSSSSSSESDSDTERKSIQKQNLAKLRQERLERERAERKKADKLVFGDPDAGKEKTDSKSEEVNQKYNSQFNPQIAKQNKLDASHKYWLN